MRLPFLGSLANMWKVCVDIPELVLGEPSKTCQIMLVSLKPFYGYLQGLDKKASTGQETFASKFTISWSPINMVKIIQVWFIYIYSYHGINWYHMLSQYGLLIKTITFLSKPQSKLFNNRFHLDLPKQTSAAAAGCWLHFANLCSFEWQDETYTWLVVYLPLWKIWKSNRSMTFPIYGKS